MSMPHFGPLGERPALKRLASLKWRTLIVAGAAASCLAAGVFFLAEPLHGILLWIYSLFTPGGGAPALHVPPELAHASGLHARLEALFLLLSLMGVVGWSAAALGRARGIAFIKLALLLAVLTVWTLPPSSPWLQVVPSQLERRIAQGDWSAARVIVASSSAQKPVKDYVLAQIAPHENGGAYLAFHAEPVLALADKLLYGLPMSDIERAALPAAVDFKPEVLWALDVALHQQPETEIGIRWQAAQASGNWLSNALPFLALSLKLALGAGLLAAAWALLRLWNSMRRRVWRIHTELHPPASAFTELQISPDASTEADTEATAKAKANTDADAKAETAPSEASLGAPAPDQTPDSFVSWSNPLWQANSLPERWQKSRRRIGLSLVALLSLGPVVLVLYASGILGASADAGLSGASADRLDASNWPCQFVGTWTSSRAESVYKVTLGEDGTYVAEPIASGAYSANVLLGKWQVEGQRISWSHPSRSGLPADTNDIFDVKPKSFALREVNGEVTRFNLITAFQTTRCPQR